VRGIGVTVTAYPGGFGRRAVEGDHCQPHKVGVGRGGGEEAPPIAVTAGTGIVPGTAGPV
jgi:hypothetical protein